MITVLVLTISDRAANGVYEDLSGPAIEQVLREQMDGVVTERIVVPDEALKIKQAIEAHETADVIITTGGTGLGPRDITPEVTAGLCTRLVPGIAEMLRRESCAQTKNAVLSRGIAGLFGQTMIINFPGSIKAARFCAELLVPLLPHIKAMIRGEGH